MKTGRSLFNRWEFFLNILVKIFKFLPKWFLSFIWLLFLNFNGLFGKLVRYLILKAKAKNVGKNVSIGSNTIIKHWNNFSCGSNVSIHENCMIDCDANILIGNDVSIAHSTSLVAANHTWEDFSTPIKYNPLTKIGIIIEDDVWVGCGVRILDGVIIESRSIIAAGAVVNKKVEKGSLVGGVPAKLIKKII
ncbi:acyltransferase [Belliella kenyensis]|uniref:Acyltransferase n=1 Tax=Belliella kenyensis TaxID=1472724 RepID=A0ABV8EGD2_9BACT|nr:acyltransferase [Belliella kenyensis]MCH7401712.1 acyltransferase [Belliella kenyensis]MDN3604212.1 acyltransferase [Belliella kenyensis]